MLVSIAGAATFVDNPNYCEHCSGQTITYPFDITNNSRNVNITESIKVTDNKRPCSTPALTIEKSVDPKTDKSQGHIPTYNYKVTNIGDVFLIAAVVFDNKTVPSALAPDESLQLNII